MNNKTISKKIIASVLIFAFILPFIFTGIYSEASETKSSLQQNMKTYGFSADLRNMTIKTTKSITRYVNAADANNKVNGLEPYAAGTYYVFKSVNGAVNISKQQNSPGSWVNARDLAGKTVSNEKTNEKKNTNVSPGGNSSTVTLKSSSKVYVNADDATKGINSKATYGAGTYYVYKSTPTAMNITRVKGQPGAWVPKTTTSKPVDNVKKPVNNTKPDITSSNGKIVIKGNVNVYMTAADALSGSNSRGSWSAGTYEIYKSYGKAINITRQAGTPGSWIDGSKLTSNQKDNNVNTNKDNNSNAPIQNTSDTVLLKESVRVYNNAYDAMSGNNPVATFSKGTYYIFNIRGNAVNISSQKGQPGGWILADVKSVPSSDIKNDSDKTNGKTFVLVLDPGHGGGAAHNRGGVLFNEGDKNFDFSKNIIKEASKYSNVVVKSTRKNNSDDPSYEDRAKFGNKADLFVSLHTNAAQSNVRGVEAWGSQKNTSKGHNFAKDITKTWSQAMSTPNRGVMYDYKDENLNPKVSYTPDSSKDDTWFVYKGNTAKEKVLLESVFHTNVKDSQAFLSNQDFLAAEFMKIVAKNFGLRLR